MDVSRQQTAPSLRRPERRRAGHRPANPPPVIAALPGVIRGVLVLLLWMPLIITPGAFQPFVVGKALYARGLIETMAVLWLVLLLWDRTYRPPRSWVLFSFGLYVFVAFVSAVAGVSFAHSIWSDYQRMMGVWDLAHWLVLTLVATSVLRSAEAWRWLLN